jgi:MFS family permease
MFTFFTLAAFPIGYITDRVGTKPVLTAGLIVYGTAIFLFAQIRPIWLFFAIRAIEGVGAAAISVATETMIGAISDAGERAKRMSYYALSVGIGWALGPVGGTSLFQIHHSLPFVGCCGLSFAAALLVSAYAPQTGSGNHHLGSLRSVLTPKMLMPVSAGSIYGYLMSSLITLFPLYLRDKGISEVLMGTILTAVIVGTILCQVPLGWAADLYGKDKVLLGCGLVLTVLFWVLPLSSHWWYYVGIGTLVGGLAGSLYPIGLSIVGSAVPPQRLGAATSLFSLAFGTGSLVGPSCSGLVMNHLGYDWLFYMPAILTAVLSLEVVLLNKRAEPPSSSHSY